MFLITQRSSNKFDQLLHSLTCVQFGAQVRMCRSLIISQHLFSFVLLMRKIENILHTNSANLLRNSKSTTTFKQRKENGEERKKNCVLDAS